MTPAEWLSLETLLSCYARDFGVGARWNRLPTHDPALAAALADTGPVFLHLPFAASGVDLYCPLAHPSRTGRQRLAQPVMLRAGGSQLRLLEAGDEAFALIEREYLARAPDGARGAARARHRFAESRAVLSTILQHGPRPMRSLAEVRFLAAEQALALGHPAHPLAKTRSGFTAQDIAAWSPELGCSFQLHWLLAHPDVVLQDSAGGPGLEVLRDELLAHSDTSAAQKQELARRHDYKLIPLHPFEARYLHERDALGAMLERGELISLGAAGKPFFATSSVRTVYRPDLPFSLKLSLHAAITNSERVNHLHELQRGVAVSRLLDSSWGRALAADCPALHFLRDFAFVAIASGGELLPGTGTVLRRNDFDPQGRIAVLAALCEPARDGASLLRTVTAQLAQARGCSIAQAARLWLDRYLTLLFSQVVRAYSRHGLALEIHQQNLLLALDEAGLPERLLFRDNQGYFFRDRARAAIEQVVPKLAAQSPCVLPDEAIHGPFIYYLMVNNVLGLIDALASQRLLDEGEALALLRARLVDQLDEDETGLVRSILDARSWPAKANLIMSLEDRDEATRPLETPATYVELLNPLAPPGQPCQSLLHPEPRRVLYRRKYAEQAHAIQIRPLDLERDLRAFLHEWVNHPYAKRFWCLEGPLDNLEAFYSELAASGCGHAFVGEMDGEPRFLFETYWTWRDPIGRAYDARPGDYGHHMLMCPNDRRPPGLTHRAFQATVEFLFRFPEVERIVGEAAVDSFACDRAIRSVGYWHDRVIQLPDKTAHLTFCSRESFLAACPDSRGFIWLPASAGEFRWTPAEVRP